MFVLLVCVCSLFVFAKCQVPIDKSIDKSLPNKTKYDYTRPDNGWDAAQCRMLNVECPLGLKLSLKITGLDYRLLLELVIPGRRR